MSKLTPADNASAVSPQDAPAKSSPRKIAANRRNARRSTGPRTSQGKRTVSCNARKHGLLVIALVVTTGNGKENQDQFDALLAGLRDCYQPVGLEEDFLVQNIAKSYWRSNRANRFERGELTQRSTSGDLRPRNEEEEEVKESLCSDEDLRHEMLQSSHQLRHLVKKVNEARKEVENSGRISGQTTKWLARYLGGNWDASSQPSLLRQLDEVIERLRQQKLLVEKVELENINRSLDCAAIPSLEAINRLSRYEGANVRQRERDMRMLRQLQSERKEKG